MTAPSNAAADRQAVVRHYAGGATVGGGEDARADGAELVARVEELLGRLGGAPLAAAQLAGLDQFHIGGLAATEALAALADVPRGADVLDAGSGLGGPSRYLAEAYECRVVGVDLVPAYVAVAGRLAERTGVAGRVRYEAGDLLRLPFGDAAFDLVWTQHVAMNVHDRAGLYGELRRVLRPGGALAFYDVLAADGHPALHFPVPWAEGPDTSTLLTESETRAVLHRAGFAVRAWREVTAEAAGWLAPAGGVGASRTSAGPSAGGLSLAAVMGPRFGAMAAALGRNIREGRVRVAMGVWSAGPV